MKKLEILILNELLNRYERSILAKSGSNRNLKITIKASDPILKNYWSEDSYLYRDQIEMSLDVLAKKAFIIVKTDANKELESIQLDISMISNVYEFLKRSNPKDGVHSVIQYLSSLETQVEFISNFSEKIIERLKSFQSVTSYFDTLESLKQYIYTIQEMYKLEEDTLKRNFSKRIFNDSKMFEKIENKICKIIREFDDFDDVDNDKILENYHIVKTPTFAYIKGDICLKIKNQVLNLRDYGHELALSSSAMNELSVIDVGVKKILTIENLTTFVTFSNYDYVCLYLGGFHNKVKRELLKKISTHNENLEFYHFGDIDAGGFLIFEDLVYKTGIQFKPYMMDIHTLKRYESNWTLLTVNDKKRLKKNMGCHFKKTIEFMLENNCKLEQEAII
jgi:chaperonin cofactor prefoldin